MSEDLDSLVQENRRLAKEARELRERVAALESSRWWRLHPRRALRLRGWSTRTVTPDSKVALKHTFPADFDERDRELCLRVQPFTMTTPPRIYALARAVEYVVGNAVPGAMVECGVWRGGSMMAVALTLRRLGVDDRDLYLYDTFEGMTEPGDEDVRHTGERAVDLLADPRAHAQYKAAASLEEVREAVLGVGYPEARIHFVKGPVEQTLPERAPEGIALLRLDTDWYSSTKHELVHLYPRLAVGGALIVDDYAYWQGARRAVDEYIDKNHLSLLRNALA
ncbi:MAG: macrocin O-methyltransferase [Actinobacteria bacterium]|nr:MAG: macrocin O-methyltransferase [Actinomycetota bacterium]